MNAHVHHLVLLLPALAVLVEDEAAQLPSKVAGGVAAPQDLRRQRAQPPQHVHHVPLESVQQVALHQAVSLLRQSAESPLCRAALAYVIACTLCMPD